MVVHMLALHATLFSFVLSELLYLDHQLPLRRCTGSGLIPYSKHVRLI